jgi:hypothetical protein
MGKTSREKWLRRVEQARGQTESSDLRKWNASWIISALIAIVVAGIVAWTGLEMMPLILIILCCWGLATILLWILTPQQSHTLSKLVSTVFLTACATGAVYWVYRNDRPIIEPSIGGIVTQNYRDKWLALDIEANIQNSGRQPSYAKSWDLDLDFKGQKFHGRQFFGEEPPTGTLKVAELRDQEFSVGKPVSGWLFFAFPDLAHVDFEPYSACGSHLANEVNIKLTVVDSKAGKEFSQTRNLGDLSKELCSPLRPKSTQQ